MESNHTDVILAVVGSRTVQDKRRVYFEIDEVIKLLNAKGMRVVEIVSGIQEDESSEREERIGVDAYARAYAKEKRIKYKGFPAEWDDMSEPCIKRRNHKGQFYNALAGPKRNTKIVEYSTHILALHLNNSPGTQDTINKVREANKKGAQKHLKIVNL